MTRLLLFSISLLSAAAIGYEILLMRLFSITQWYHFAYMVIGLALLGFGASGTFLVFAREVLARRFVPAFAVFAGLFGVTAIAATWAAQLVPFNALEVVWDPRQFVYLFAIYLLLAVPFFCAATSIGLALYELRASAARVYRADLIGAGLGAAAIVGVMFALPLDRCFAVLAGAGLTAAGLALTSDRQTLGRGVLCVAVAAAAAAVLPSELLAPRLNPYKALGQALTAPGAEVVSQVSGPLGLLTVVRNDKVPLRHAPGLSLNAAPGIPEQLAIYTDGDSPTAITRFDGDPATAAYLDWRTAALPYHLVATPRVLVLGAGGGDEVLLALYHGARSIDAVELNSQMVHLVGRTHAEFGGRPFDRPNVSLHVGEARSFAATSDQAYDLIQISLLDSFSAAAAGLLALNESTLYTVEALQAFLARLAPGGVLAITRWMRLPPRGSLKLAATALSALRRAGIAKPRNHIAAVRAWNAITLVVTKNALEPTQQAAVKRFAEARSFDLAYLPGITAEETNRFNVIGEPTVYRSIEALLGDAASEFIDAYPFSLAPATDNRPYFFHFFKWRILPELLEMRAAGGIPFVEWGYAILLATLAQALLASTILILLPLWVLKRSGSARVKGHFWSTAAYFGAIGLAFLFIEISFMQRFVLLLGNPLYAVVVVLAGFLVFAGLGSGWSARLRRHAPGGTVPWAIPGAVAGIVGLTLVYLVLLPGVFEALRPLPEAAKISAALAFIAPLAFAMGMPFPLALQSLGETSPDLVPWAWGINGCASVISAVLATLIAIDWGFDIVILAACGIYAGAALVYRMGLGRGRDRQAPGPNPTIAN